LRTLSDGLPIPFTRYIRHVLPLDGYVYWLSTGVTMPVVGAVHDTADRRQLEDETIAVNRMVLTTTEEINAFNEMAPDDLWVGAIAGVRFAFSRSGPRYKLTGLYHYVGDALYPALESQLVDVGSQLADRQLVVSNSLPAWLSLRTYEPEWLNAPNPRITLYPSFLVPANLPPPYGTVHVFPDSVRALQAFPSLGHWTTSQHQLTSERVRITLYGSTNDRVMAFTNLVTQFSQDTGFIGMMAPPSPPRDEKRVQAELGVIAMKKTIEYEISYVQGALRNLARVLLEQATVSVSASPIGTPNPAAVAYAFLNLV
jgi:hypothetical protein